MRLVVSSRQSVFFVSDAHLGSGADTESRARMLVDLLRGFRERAARVYILGDLFDFWFEYRHAIPKGHFPVLRAIAELVEADIPVHYLGGNHDFWCGSYLTREVGVEAHATPIDEEIQGRRMHMAHGDGLDPADRGYRRLKALLRNRVAIALYRSIHPDIGIPFAHRVSSVSRRHTQSRRFYLERMARHLAIPRFREGRDAIVVGHVHDPMHLRDRWGRDLLVLGDWLENFTYGHLAEGRFTLEKYRAGNAPEILDAQAWPTDLEEELPPSGKIASAASNPLD